MTDSVTVEQCDRDAAAVYGQAVGILTRLEAAQMLNGANDECTVVQHFARHRTASEQRGYDRAIAEVVAWLREQGRGLNIAGQVYAWAEQIEDGEHKV